MNDEVKDFIDIINKVENFNAKWDDEIQSPVVSYKNINLFTLTSYYPVMLSRQLGYDLKTSDMLKTGLSFHSLEEMRDSEGYTEYYHEHFYSFIKPISSEKVEVLIKYFDVPKTKDVDNTEEYFAHIRAKVKASPNYKIVFVPFGPETLDMRCKINGFDMRPKSDDAFYFLTEFDAETYGDVMLKVDQIIFELEN